MPTIPLLNPNANPDAWHQVASPGGYEWWYFDAEQTDGDLRIVAIFHHGYAFHPAYLREYASYRRRPTRNTPPLPAQYPCVYFALYRGSEIVAQFLAQFSAEDFNASIDRTEVTIGGNRLISGEDGSLELQLTGVPWEANGRSPRMLENQRVNASLRFVPVFKHEPIQRQLFSRNWSDADHHWVIANPLCEVAGQVELNDTAGKLSQTFAVRGQGYHDHHYGSGPIGPGLRRWMWGRVLMPDHAVIFHFAQPMDGSLADEVHLLEAEQLGQRELPVNRFNADWSLRTSKYLKYPAWVETGAMQLVNPTVVDASAFHLRLCYQASLRGVNATAFCQIIYPHRLGWPVVGKMIERSINGSPGGTE